MATNNDSTTTKELPPIPSTPFELMEQAIASRDIDYVNANLNMLGFVQDANTILNVEDVSEIYATGQITLSTQAHSTPSISGSTDKLPPTSVAPYRPKVRRDDSRKEAGTYFIKQGN